MSGAAPLHDLDALRAQATAEVAILARDLLGEPSRAHSTKRRLAWGSRGALQVEVRGPRQGLWIDRSAAGVGGDVFDLVRLAHGCSFAQAADWLAARYGAAPAPIVRLRPRLVRTGPSPEELAEDARAIGDAQAITRAAEPIAEGSIGALYLEHERRIPRPAHGWPAALRYHPGQRVLVAVATLADGTVRAVQRVRLTREGTKAEALPDHPVKITNGRQAEAVVRLPGDPAGPLVLCEGPENAATVWAASRHETWAVLGVSNLAKLALPAGRRVVLFRDDDRLHSPADKAVRSALAVWRKVGADVAAITAYASRRGDKGDANDLCQAEGIEAVAARIASALPQPEPPPAPGLPLGAARTLLDEVVRDFFAAAAAFDPDMAAIEGTVPPVHGARVSVGVGKSHSARLHAIRLLVDLRRRGSRKNVALVVPTHRLGSEQAALLSEHPEFRAAGLRVDVWRGRAALDPDAPEFSDPAVPEKDKPRMCRNLDAVHEVQALGLDADSAVCRRLVPDGTGEKIAYECPFYRDCAYQAERRRTADLWLCAHELLFLEKPAALGDLAAVVVDESAWQDGLDGVDGPPVLLPLEALGAADKRFRGEREADWAVLQHHRARVLDVLRASTDGPVSRDMLEAAEVTSQDATEARALEFERKVDPRVHPGMSREARRTALKAAEGNRTILRLAWFWRAMEALLADGGPSLSGWADLVTSEGEDGPMRAIRLRGRRPIRAGWQVPTLLIDALLAPDLARPFWPQLEMTADVQAATPHQRIRQVTDRSYALSRLAPLDAEKAEADPVEARRRVKNLREARAILVREARRHWPGRVLAVAQKGVREALVALGGLPRNLELAHHNAVAGQDGWRDVAGLVVIGRTAAPPVAVERMAAALTGSAVTPLQGWYQRATGARLMADGSSVGAEVDRHPDPTAEAIRAQVCEGELLQIIGRARGVSRTEADPVDVLAMVDVPLPMPIHEALTAADVAPDLADRMLAEGGVSFDSPRDAAETYPALWPSKNAAKLAAKEAKVGCFPYKKLPIGKAPHLRRVDYQRAGRGQQPAVAWFDPHLTPDPEAVLVALLGPLAWCRVEAPPEPDPPPPAPPDRRQRAAVGTSSPSPTSPQEPAMPPDTPAAAVRPAACPVSPPRSSQVPLGIPLGTPLGTAASFAPIEHLLMVSGRDGTPMGLLTGFYLGVVTFERLPGFMPAPHARALSPAQVGVLS